MSKPKVFIGWSGDKSKKLADDLCGWLANVITPIEPFVSVRIGAGDEWRDRLTTELKEAYFGIFCITSDNLAAPWIMFEAGAVWNKLERGRVCPYLLDIEPSGLKPPLTWFQAKKATEDETKELIIAINKSLGSDIQLTQDQINNSFKKNWGDLKRKIEVIANAAGKESSSDKTSDTGAEAFPVTQDTQQPANTGLISAASNDNLGAVSEELNLVEEEVLMVMLQHGLPRDLATSYSMIHKIMVSRRFAEVAVNWSLLSLTNKEFIESTEVGSANAYLITNKGLNWLMANDRRINFREAPRK